MKTWELVVAVILLFIGQGFATWYFAYFKKKGEYEAIKENIEQITRTTESIKKELDLITENEISFRSGRRNAIIEYFESINRVFLHIITRMKIHTGDDLLPAYSESIYPQHSIAISKLLLFLESNEVARLSNEIEEILNKVLTSAVTGAKRISELVDSDGEDASEQIIAIGRGHRVVVQEMQKQFFEKRNELAVRFREILKQDLAHKS